MTKLWVLIPAAGSGTRFDGTRPKQYVMLAGKTVLENTLLAFTQRKDVAGVVVMVADNDPWLTPGFLPNTVMVASGGDTRAQSVLNGLNYLQTQQHITHVDDDWVMVHDAARPCITQHDIDAVWHHAKINGVGALLGVPVNDTLKRVEHGHVVETVDRSSLFCAQTPQVFRLSLLHQALVTMRQRGQTVTDESSAMEQMGHKVTLVAGKPSNIKITYRDDLMLASQWLARDNEALSL